MKVFFYALFIHITLGAYVCRRGYDILRHRPTLQTALWVTFAFEFIIYILGLLFQKYMPDAMLRIIALTATSWMIFSIYASMFIAAADLMFRLWRRRIRSTSYEVVRWQKAREMAFASILVVVVGLMWWGNYRFRHPVVVEQQIVVDKAADGQGTLRVAVVGDTHLGLLIDKRHAQRFVNLIMEQKPDLILFVGDIIDASIVPEIKQQMGDDLRKLNAPLGVFSCTGNHEYRNEAEAKIAWLNSNGIAMLRDSAVLINDAFYVIGREDVDAPFARKPLTTIIAEQHIDRNKPIIVLNHNPKYMNEDVAAEADIALYGHTHRGQFFPGNIYADLIFELSHGYKKKGNTHLYVTSGLGLAGPQYRIGTQSEIVMLTVRFSQ